MFVIEKKHWMIVLLEACVKLYKKMEIIMNKKLIVGLVLGMIVCSSVIAKRCSTVARLDYHAGVQHVEPRVRQEVSVRQGLNVQVISEAVTRSQSQLEEWIGTRDWLKNLQDLEEVGDFSSADTQFGKMYWTIMWNKITLEIESVIALAYSLDENIEIDEPLKPVVDRYITVMVEYIQTLGCEVSRINIQKANGISDEAMEYFRNNMEDVNSILLAVTDDLEIEGGE
ncbi:MAG: hypothetical protein ACJAZS_000852 [Alteromonas naphthalenivorans]|jgi:hypothetical protein